MKRRMKKKLKNTLIGLSFVLAWIMCVAALSTVGEPGFTWDKLPELLVITGASLAWMQLIGYANRRPAKKPDAAAGEKERTKEEKAS